jgi:hypothetical protein
MSCLVRLMRPVLALAALVLLSGCVVAPAGPYYGGPAYAPGPTVVVPVTPYYYGGGYGGYRGGYGHYR